LIWIEPAKRERKGNYSVDQYYREAINPGYKKPSDKPKVVRAPKQVHINEFQFYPPRLVELQNREFDAHRVSGVRYIRETEADDRRRKHKHMSCLLESRRRVRLLNRLSKRDWRSRRGLITVSYRLRDNRQAADVD
jgi:SWI/SNF-related matrix-associated actin-dependent regulator of chromatin subfamily A member 5